MTADQHTGISWFARWWSIFSLLLVLTSGATAGEPEYGDNKGKVFSEEETRYTVRFQGKDYHALYEQQIKAGVPIDLYYYKIPPYKGVPAAQDSQDLWGRFVRVPSANDVDQSSVVWWHAWWTYENGRWLYHQADNIPPPKVSKEEKSGARENMRHTPEQEVPRSNSPTPSSSPVGKPRTPAASRPAAKKQAPTPTRTPKIPDDLGDLD
jgi:hypothetical protein